MKLALSPHDSITFSFFSSKESLDLYLEYLPLKSTKKKSDCYIFLSERQIRELNLFCNLEECIFLPNIRKLF